MIREAGSADYNLRLLEPLARFIAERPEGDAQLAKILTHTSVAAADFKSRIKWITHAEFESILAEARPLFESDEEFRDACAYHLAEGWGALGMVFWGATPRLVYSTSERMNSFMTTVGRFEVRGTSATSARLRYTSERSESRLMCLSRQSQSAKVPTLFGLPEARIEELSCMSKGDAACEYEFTWILRRRWLFPTLAAIATAPAAFVAHHPAAYLVPALAAAVGLAIDARNVDRGNLRSMEGAAETLRKTIAEEANVRRELLALQDRQAAWGRLIETTRADQQLTLDRLAEQLHGMQEERNSALLGLGHDLRNPLAVVSANLHFLDDGSMSSDQVEVLQEMKVATDRMASMLGDMMTVVRSNVNRLELRPEAVATSPLVAQVRRRASALAFGKDIRVTVFSNRECPDSIWIDPIALDRIIDNLLTNAAKYTDRGSIIVELDGVPDYFVLKVGDTGRGIANDSIDNVFRPGASNEAQRAPNSYGVGLSAVVELLLQIGGRLEVMSTEKVGSTFWVYIPLRAHEGAKVYSVEDRKSGKHLLDVVRIRRTPA